MTIIADSQHDAPRPLIRPLPPATPFPIDVLAGVPARTIRAIEAIVQAPLALCAQSVLAALTMAVQAHANVMLPIGPGLERPLVLFFLPVGQSGERKTTIDALAMAPIRLHERLLADQYRALCAAYEEARREGDKTVTRPIDPTLIQTEPTTEALLKALATGQPSVGIFSDEGGRFLGGHAMKPEEAMKSMATFSELWDGSVMRRERATEGAPMRLEGRRVTICLLVQPGVAQTFLGNPMAREQGMLSRMLVTAPESTMGTRFFREPDPAHEQVLTEYGQQLLELLAVPLPIRPGTANELAPRRLPMSQTAKAIWVRFSDEMERELAPHGRYRPIAGFAAKLAEHAARLAGVLTLIEDLGAAEIPVRQMEAGIALAQFYASEAERLFGIVSVPAPLQAAQRALDWLLDHWAGEAISLIQLYQLGPREIRTARAAGEIAAVLEEHGWLVRSGTIKKTPVWRLMRP